jgi:hypothetical protein
MQGFTARRPQDLARYEERLRKQGCPNNDQLLWLSGPEHGRIIPLDGVIGAGLLVSWKI